MPTYSQIATTTVASTSASTISFTSLGSYTDLFIVASIQGGRSIYGGDFHCRFNNDSGANYASTFMRSSSAGTNTSSYTGLNEINLGGQMGAVGTSNFSLFHCFVPNYRNTSVYKSIHAFQSGAGSEFTQQDYTLGSWDSTAAITSVQFFNAQNTYTIGAGSTISIYGVLAA
jgi:hypothetical protein